MSQPASSYTLQELVQGCRAESRQPYLKEIGCCFELFRRALEGKDEMAWEMIQQQYGVLVKEWVQVTAHHSLDQNEVEDLSQEAFIKFWHTLSKQPTPLQERFKHVGGLLKYLKQCVITAVFDFRRRQEQERYLCQRLLWSEERPFEALSTLCLDRLIAGEQIESIQNWLQTHLIDFCERLVIQLTFEQNLSPQQIARCYPQYFATVRDVYRIKVLFLMRAKRSFKLRHETGG